MQKKFNILILFVVIFIAETSYAVKEIIFRQQTQVYSKRNENSEVLGVYDRGDTIPISSKVYGRWRKVIVDVRGKKQIGWIAIKDIRGARIKDSKARQIEEDEKDGVVNYRRRTGVGIIGNLSYVYQTEGSVDFESAGTTLKLDYSSMSGANVFVGLFGDFNLSSTRAIRGYFAMRNMKRSGSAFVDVMGGTNGNFAIIHDMLAIGATYKFYSSASSVFWWGPGLEIATTTKFSIKGPNNIEADVKDQPLYFLPSISAGADYNLGGRFFILPEVKFGLVPNGDPILATFEILFPIAFTF